MARSRVVVAAHIICYINGQRFGRLSHFSFRSVTQRRALYGLDSVDPNELAVTQTKISGNMKVFRTIGDGGAEGAGMASAYEDLPREKYFTIQLVERGSDQIIFQAEMCACISQSWDIPAKGVVSGTIDFEAISWSNEIRPLGESG